MIYRRARLAKSAQSLLGVSASCKCPSARPQVGRTAHAGCRFDFPRLRDRTASLLETSGRSNASSPDWARRCGGEARAQRSHAARAREGCLSCIQAHEPQRADGRGPWAPGPL